MIAVDTSSFIAYFSGAKGLDVEALHIALDHKQVVIPPAVLSELLSDPKLPPTMIKLFKELPLLNLHPGYWERVGFLRAKLLAKNLRARLADALIAQSCLDHEISLITRDGDFRHFSRFAGLKLFV